MPNGSKSNVKLFPDDTSIFNIVRNRNGSVKNLTHDLSLISKWAFKWKMLFNPHPTKSAKEVIFSIKKDGLLIQIYFLMTYQSKDLFITRIKCGLCIKTFGSKLFSSSLKCLLIVTFCLVPLCPF